MTDGAEPALGPKPNSLHLDIGCASTEVSVGGNGQVWEWVEISGGMSKLYRTPQHIYIPSVWSYLPK